MSFDAAKYIAGPAIITWGAAASRYTAYTKSDIAVRMSRETWDVVTSMHGTIDRRAKSLPIAEVSFTPAGCLDTAAALWPYDAGDVGKSIFPTTDETLVIHSLGGIKYTFARAAMIKMPNLKLAASDTALGEVTFLCLVKNNTAPTAADAFVKIETAAFSDTSFDETNILSPGYTAALGARSTPYNAMESIDGFTVEFETDIRRDMIDRYGVISARLTSLAARATFAPTGLTEAQLATLLAFDGASALVPGQSLAGANENLVISGTGLTVTLYDVGIQAQDLAFGDAPRMGQLAFVGRRTWTAGAADPLFLITIA